MHSRKRGCQLCWHQARLLPRDQWLLAMTVLMEEKLAMLTVADWLETVAQHLPLELHMLISNGGTAVAIMSKFLMVEQCN